MATRIRTLNFLPEIFQTETNKQFLAATLDQLVAQPELKKTQGYVGSKFGYGINAKDYYVIEPTKIRRDYQLDPGIVFTKNNESVAQDFISYPGILDSLKLEGGITQDNNRLFESQFYSWDSFTNLDKIINFSQYYWLPEGPEQVVVSASTVYSTNDYIVTDVVNGYQISGIGEGAGTTNPTLTLLRGGTYRFAVNQSTQFWIQGAPGITGFSPTQPNIQTRDVYGVSNNGATTGVVTFQVPFKDAQDEYNYPGNNTVGVVSTRTFAEINGQLLSDVGNIDGITALEGLTVMFYETGNPTEIGYVSNFYDYTNYDTNEGLVAAQTISITDTNSVGNLITCDSTANLTVGDTITFTGTPFGGLSQYSTTLPDTIYYVSSISSATEFTVSLSIGGSDVTLSTASGTMIGNINQGLYEEGFYTQVSENFYRIEYIGDTSDPVLRLIPVSEIPTNQKITAQYGTQYIGRSFYRNPAGAIVLIPYISAPLDTLYYQDGTNPNKVGVIRLIESNDTNRLDIEVDVLGQKNFTSTNGVVFTNGLKVVFEGDVVPASYLSGSYYVEGVGSAIELIPVNDLIAPEPFTSSTFNPFDVAPYDIGNYDVNLYVPITPDYITIARNSINKNPWSRSNRWFHIDVINATASYNNDPDSISLYATADAKAKRPIVEFYPNLKLFNSGSEGKAPIDFIDFRTTDAFSLVVGQENYYPDVEVYTSYTATIAAASAATSTTITIDADDITGTFSVGQYIADSTNILPTNTVITAVTGTSTITLTVEWADSTNISATSVASIIATDTTVNNYALFEGSRVVFAADEDENVRNKIYVSRFTSIDGVSTPVITLTEAEDGLVLPDQQTVAFRGYNYQGKDFWFDGIEWTESQTKTTVNQAPYFDVFDENGISFGDTEVYIGTSFNGSTLFQYGLGSGGDDIILGFPLRYSSIDNIGDISFDVTLNSDTFDYVSGTDPITQNVNTGFVYNYSTRTEYTRQLGWQTAVAPSMQYQVFEFNYFADTPEISYVLDVSALSIDDTVWPPVQVFINNVLQASSNYTVTTTDSSTTIVLGVTPEVDTVIQILVLSDQVSTSAYYTIPINLNNNPFNTDVTTANIGDIRGHYQSIFYNNPDTTGQVFGPNNFRDLGNLVPWGSRIIQNSASLVLPGTFLRKQQHSLFNALMFNSREYIKFKNLLVDIVNDTAYQQRYDPSILLDDALDQITATKTENDSFFWSDMLPSKAPFVSNSYSFANSLDISIYPLTRVYYYASANYYGVLVYLSRTEDGVTSNRQLIKDTDYTISTDSPSLTVTIGLQPGDVVTVKEYNQTYGSYVPNTPTKLGLYPAFEPQVILDSEYTFPTYFILGHDGSYTKLYGDYDPDFGILIDFRDQVLLEFEKRVYNNLKLSSEIPIKAYEVTPGFFRDSDYTYDEYLQIYTPAFLNWIGQNRLNYKTQLYNTNNQFTYNYSNSGNKLNNAPIPQGYWRGIYEYFYDTTTPNVTPWEMLGFTEQPSWWTSRYGPAPYTSDNLVLWNDLAEGINWNNGAPFVIPEAVRPGLLNILPVDSAGDLLSPLISIVGNYNSNSFRKDWKVGDDAPVEWSYRRSSTYPFDLMRIMALTKPAKFFNLGVDLDNYKYNAEFDQYLVNGRSHLVIDQVQIYGSGTAKTSYINWIVDYEKQVGLNATANITDLLFNLDVRLVYRLAGFSDKTLLKFYVEKGTPNSRNASLLIPDESYSVLLYDNQPFERIMFSGVVIQITDNGYTVYGNSQTNAYFNTLVPQNNGMFENITVENITVKASKNYSSTVDTIPYGTIFYTPQDVAQFVLAYGAYLESQGMVFDQIESGLEVNWNQMVAEFLYWAQIGWETGSVVTLNPAATQLKVSRDSYIVQPLTIQRNNFLLNQNLYPIQLNDLAINRQDVTFQANTLNPGDTIAYGQFNISNFEHGIVFDNVTLFDDIIYNLVTGLRQTRVKLVGTKSADWNGTVNAAGFILNQDNIEEWKRDVTYTKGSIVKFKNKYWTALKIVQPAEIFNELDWKQTDYNEIQKGLLPNPSTRSYESTLYYDVNQANLEQDADLLSFSLIGYRPRDYLALADLTDITQINVYKNMIKNKGTRNAVSAFKGAQLPQGGIDYDVYENWAIKSGEFGGVLNSNFVQFKVNEQKMTGNPSIVSLTNGTSTIGSQQEVPLYSLIGYGRPISNPDILPTIQSYEPSLLFPDSGYANFDDVKMSAYFYSQLPQAVDENNIIVSLNNFYVRDYVWLANYLQRWEIFTPISIGQISRVTNNLNNTATVTFAETHNLSQYQIFAILNLNTAVNGYYIVNQVVDPYRVIINLVLNTQITQITGNGIGLRFQSQRVAKPSDINDLPLLNFEFVKNKVWVDENTDGSWAVYRKSINYQNEFDITQDIGESFGSAVAYNNTLGYLVGDADEGKVFRYIRNALTETYQLEQTITQGASFGTTIAHENDIFVISEPTGNKRVHIYQLISNELFNQLSVYQTYISAPAGSINWGKSVALSGDTNWLYIADYDNTSNPNIVYVYRKSNSFNVAAGSFTVGDNYVIQSLGNTDWNTVAGTSDVSYQVGDNFRAATIGSGTGIATKNNYEYATFITVPGLATTDRFGYSITTDYYGKKLIISAPNKDYDQVTDNWGYAYVFNRTVQNVEAQFNTTTAQNFNLAWTPETISTLCTATAAATELITCSSTIGFSVNDPVIFSGTPYSGSNISPDQVYYIYSIDSGTTFKIKESRTSASAFDLGTSSGSSMYANVQKAPLYVSVNGTVVTDNNYAAIGSVLRYTGSLNAGDIVEISGTQFILEQTLTTQTQPRVGVQFGTSVDCNKYGSEILVGAPFYLNAQNQEGAVFRYTNAGSKYGMIIGTGDCSVPVSRQILLNGFLINIPAGNATVVANAINSSNIPNVIASASVNNNIIIQTIDNSIALTTNKLNIQVTDPVILTELGISIYTQTQIIGCPHPEGPTQFGSVIKFNEFDSFVASAPVGTKCLATTFDFTDDENLDNDTVFDNNATQFVDKYPNVGAVYMFDYLSNYNESLSNVGEFVYAQCLNSLDQESGNQPRYGHALDFNDYHVVVGTPEFRFGFFNGQVVSFVNESGINDWSVFRSSSSIVDINKIQNIQLFSNETNETLINLDYIDPLQGKILGGARQNIDVVSNADPAAYNLPSNKTGNQAWGAAYLGHIWFDTTNVRFVNYHQNDVTYNSKYWGTVFPGSDVAVYSWIESTVPPEQYQGPGTPYDFSKFSVQYILNSEGAIVPIFYFWARNTNIIFTKQGKTLADSIIESYIQSPKSSGISYFVPLLPNTFGLYNSGSYINANDSVLNIGFSTGNNDDVAHTQYDLIRSNYADDFLPGIPAINSNLVPEGLYDRMLDSLAGVDESGQVVPDPYLPKRVQYGVLARPRQSFFFDRFKALQNYLEYANEILSQFPVTETRQASFLFREGEFYDTTAYWEYENWWAVGYDNTTKSALQVPLYSDLARLNVTNGTLVTVAENGNGQSETYRYDGDNLWTRIGLQNGTYRFKNYLWDYAEAKLGFSGDFFDTTSYDLYPSEETKWIIRALNEQIYIEDLLIYRNRSLILLFDFIQSETIDSQNYLPWLNKTSFIDVFHTIRELRPIEVFQSDNQDFLAGYINEVKPYHVVVKEFVFKYTGEEVYEGNITDFDIPAYYDADNRSYISPELVYSNPSTDSQFLPTAEIWRNSPYNQWFDNYGVSLTGQDNYQITVLSTYIGLNTTAFAVDNAQGFPINGIVTIGQEQIGYSSVDRALNVLSGLTRGVNGTTISAHIPGELLYINLPAVLLLDGGRGYSEPPKVVAEIDTTLYPEPRRPAVLEAVMSLDSVLRIDVIDPGSGYVVLPKIVIDPAVISPFTSTDINTSNSTITIYAPILQTGDLVQYKVGTDSTAVGGLQNDQWYYINVLETTPTVVIALYSSYLDAISDHDRITLFSQGTGVDHSLNVGARASTISTAAPVRENNIKLRYDRTTYNSQLTDWESGSFYGAFYAGSYSNSEKVASSSIQLESTQPPISSVLASAQGAVFEIVDVDNDQVVTYSTLIRNVASTQTGDIIRLAPFSNSWDATGSILGTTLNITAIESGTITAGDLLTGVGILSGTFVVSQISGDTGGIGLYVVSQSQTVSSTNIISYLPNASGSTLGFYVDMPIKFRGAVGTTNIVNDTVYYVKSVINETDFTISATVSGSTFSLNAETISVAGLECFVGEVTNTAVITVNYPGIETVTATNSTTNTVTVPLNLLGTGGTRGFYTGLPLFFTGNDPSATNNGVFGGIIENEVYYVVSVIDLENFTISETNDAQILDVTETVASNDTVIVNDTTGLRVNDPVIFSNMEIGGSAVTTFGGITAGTIYYINQVVGPTSLKLSTIVNGGAISLTDETGTAYMTNQRNVVQLTTATGEMTVNISLPVSPGQVNGQLFTFYTSSGQTTGLTGTTDNLIDRDIEATIATIDRVVLSDSSGGLTNIYINMPFEVEENIGNLTVSTQYYVIDYGTIEIEVTSTSSSTNGLTCDTTESLYVNMPITFTGESLGGIDIGSEYYVYAINSSDEFQIATSPVASAPLTLTTSNGVMTGTGPGYVEVSTTEGGSAETLVDSRQKSFITNDSPAEVITYSTTITAGSFVISSSYVILTLGTTDFTLIGASSNTVGEVFTATGTGSGTGTAGLINTAPANNTPVKFITRDTLPEPLDIDTTYYVVNSSSGTFNIALTQGGTAIDTTTSGSGTHYVYEVSNLIQTPLSTPVFDVSYILGGYRVIINDPGSGFAVDNTITIPGTLLGGSTPANDLTLTVSLVNILVDDPYESDGEIVSVICSGTPAGTETQYYLKVIGPNQFEVYSNPLMTVPVSGLTIPFVGITSTTATAVTASNDRITVTSSNDFDINDEVIFTGTVFGGIELGQSYYVKSKPTSTTVTISESPAGTTFNIASDASGSMTMAKPGSFTLLPEPFYFNQSIVKYNNRVYLCIISNNDDEFIFGKWQLLDQGDFRLNALDRVIGYYQPTDNMPGLDLTQLFEGIRYPNSIYYGNPFAPGSQYELDTLLQDQEFYPTNIDVQSVVWNGTTYLAPSNLTEYSALIVSEDGVNWTIVKLADAPIQVRDIIIGNGVYVLTTNNPATPIFRSNDGITWTSNGDFTPYSATPYATTPYDLTALSVASLSLNAAAYYDNKYIAVGENIVLSTDTYSWVEVFTYTSGLVNTLYDIDAANITTFTGFVAVGQGQQFDYSTGVTITVPTNLLLTSPDGYAWTEIASLTPKGFYGVASNGTQIIIVGQDGVIYNSTDGVIFNGVNETTVTSVNSSLNYINVRNSQGLTVGDEVRFTESFDVISSSTTYYVVNVVSTSQIQVSTSSGGSPVTLTGVNPTTTTYVYLYPRTASLNDVLYADSMWIAVGDEGLIRTSADGIIWTTQTSGITENLNDVSYDTTQISGAQFIAVGENNTVIISQDNGVTWTSSPVFAVDPTDYDVQGDPFASGYGPEELVPGVVSDNITMIVNTRPGTNWSATEYAHVGYNVVSVELSPINASQVEYSFLDVTQSPAQIAVYVIDGTTGLGTRIYDGIDFSIDWVASKVILDSASTVDFLQNDKLRIDVYEVGNGDQLVKADTKTDPIRYNNTTGWNEIYVNCNYSENIFNGSGVIQTGTFPVQVEAIATDATSDTITCSNVSDFILNEPITFQGDVFGGIAEDTTYYVKTISTVTNSITVSTTFNVGTGTAGPTLALTTDTGSMYAIINVGSGVVWTEPIVIHNGNKLVLGKTNIVNKTDSTTNTITTNSTGGMIVDTPIVFSDGMFGGVEPQTVYYVKQIVDANEFTISETQGGTVFVLTDGTGGAQFITSDYAFGLADNGISAKIMFAAQYNNVTDFISYTLFGETSPVQYGYTLPETQVIPSTGSNSYSLTNYLGGDNITNAVVEVDGLRITESQYTISQSLSTITFDSPPVANSIIAVTTYNQTDRQYLNTQYGITGTSGSGAITLTISDTVHEPGYDALVTAGDFVVGETYVIVTVGTTDFTAIGASSNTVGVEFTATGAGSGTGTAAVGFGDDGFSPGPDYLVVSVGDTTELNVNDRIVFTAPTLGGLTAGATYYVSQILTSTTFSISSLVGGDYEILTTDSGSMIASTNPLTVADIISINNAITPALGQTNVSAATAATDRFTCVDSAEMVIGQPVLFKAGIATAGSFTIGKSYQIRTIGTTDFTSIGASSNTVGEVFTATGAGSGTGTALLASFGGISTLGTVYYVGSTPTSITFTVEDQDGNLITLTDDTGLVVAICGGQPAVRVTTGIDNNFVENEFILIDGTTGSVQLNDNNYYAKIINSTTFDLYTEPYDPALVAVNYPVTTISTYTGGGYAWKAGLFTLIAQVATATAASTNYITVASTSQLVVDTPVIFTAPLLVDGDTTLGGLIIGEIYYIREVASATEFTVSETRGGDAVILTTESGVMNVTQWEQDNVDRLWVTVNGYRIPSSSLRLNPSNEVSILTIIEPGDEVIITSMMPSATPNEEVYLLNVNQTNNAIVYRANTQTRTWLTQDLYALNNTIYVDDVTRITDTVIQTETTPAVSNGFYNIGLVADKNTLSSIRVYNETKGAVISSGNYEIVIEELAPILRITAGSWIAPGDLLTITMLEGNLIYINGEQISFTTVDFDNNTLTGLGRGANGTAVSALSPKYSEVFGLLSNNRMSNIDYSETWNSNIYNTVDGDPLQISVTNPAIFLIRDIT